MKIAFVFPGQGSQAVGMLDSFRDNAAVRSIVTRASSALGQNISALIDSGPAEDLNLTINTQPALLTAGYAMYAAWRAAGGSEPLLVAGHSLGEYTALVAAGALELEDAVRLVRFRAQAMQEAVPVGIGSMAAILGLTDEAVQEACSEAAQGEVVEPVNFNAPSQVVIAGHASAVQRACEIAKRLGAKRAVPLTVSAPFHSSLLQPASDRLRERLAQTTLRKARIDLINNVDVSIESEPVRIADALARQAARPVRWADSVRRMSELGVTHVIECGPGRVLSGLTKRIAPGLESLVVNDAGTLASSLTALGHTNEL
ncbi:MAG: ACP S-malonyltransferase [Pseudomonadota bacterium]|nr:ACP S-malonyltransferase [Burkholderiaceae bacterium]MDQ3446671.1 ACP S-malonyltransferase [Pseudomonadota bacterium]